MEIELGKNSQFFVQITIRTRPPIYPLETKCFSVRDKIIDGHEEIYFMHINTTICVVLLHGKLDNIIIQHRGILFQHISFLISDFYGVENMSKKSFFEHTWAQDVVLKSVFI